MIYLVSGSALHFSVTNKDNDMTEDQNIIRTKVCVLGLLSILAKSARPARSLFTKTHELFPRF